MPTSSAGRVRELPRVEMAGAGGNLEAAKGTGHKVKAKGAILACLRSCFRGGEAVQGHDARGGGSVAGMAGAGADHLMIKCLFVAKALGSRPNTRDETVAREREREEEEQTETERKS